VFGTVLILVTTFMHIYVFWRAASVPIVGRYLPKKVLIGSGVILWTIFYLGRVVGRGETGQLAAILEFIGMTWMASLFLTFISLLAIDIVTVFGFFLPRLSPSLRGWGFLIGAGLSIIALFQGIRPPVVEKYEVRLPSLPDHLDGTVLVALSDMHLGSQLDERWLAERIVQVGDQRPDLVVLLGDIFEGHGTNEDDFIAKFKQLYAPMGVWAVLGNHESHRGGNIHPFEEAGFKLLRNKWTEVRPGLILAGIDDLTTLQRKRQVGDPISEALTGRPPGATVLLSHTPWKADRAAKFGAELMLSGHTHGGQIWPFDYLTRTRYPLLEGRYEVDDMTVIVSRGTGTWGPRMRLWSPGEILRVTLRGNGKNIQAEANKNDF
jgi:uncharacterized protein